MRHLALSSSSALSFLPCHNLQHEPSESLGFRYRFWRQRDLPLRLQNLTHNEIDHVSSTLPEGIDKTASSIT